MPVFYAFIRTAEAERLGIDLDKVYSPYDLWNSKLPPKSYCLVSVSRSKNNPEYLELDGNPEYTKRVVSGN